MGNFSSTFRLILLVDLSFSDMSNYTRVWVLIELSSCCLSTGSFVWILTDFALGLSHRWFVFFAAGSRSPWVCLVVVVRALWG
jgi:hypothetical protein